MNANCLMRRVLLIVAIFTLALWQSAAAQPPEKPGIPGVPGLVAEIAELNAQIEELEAILQEYEEFAPVPKTGQTISYLTGDDGDLRKGVPWPHPRFTDNDDDTVTDNLTGLIWTQNANLYGVTTLGVAFASCSSSYEGGHTDWRLPNLRELESLIDYGGPQYSKLPAGHPFTAPSGPEYYYWSSTTHGTTSALCISFENGFVLAMGGFHPVWCVRGPDDVN
ncbi:MAG: DUF1566 domain-containing protein [candidate division Zixibacteria bacterium]|nr:DUF1566 domain-containing protein [candidate division Zixibacteria bacterium]